MSEFSEKCMKALELSVCVIAMRITVMAVAISV